VQWSNTQLHSLSRTAACMEHIATFDEAIIMHVSYVFARYSGFNKWMQNAVEFHSQPWHFDTPIAMAKDPYKYEYGNHALNMGWCLFVTRIYPSCWQMMSSYGYIRSHIATSAHPSHPKCLEIVELTFVGNYNQRLSCIHILLSLVIKWNGVTNWSIFAIFPFGPVDLSGQTYTSCQDHFSKVWYICSFSSSSTY
jgi:hypothetical protein